MIAAFFWFTVLVCALGFIGCLPDLWRAICAASDREVEKHVAAALDEVDGRWQR